MATRDVVVVGASAGGVEALRAVVGGIPADLPATVLVILHLPAGTRSSLPAILSRAGRLPARHPVNGDELRAGEILVAPPDHHLTIENGHVRLTHGPMENGHRPALDPLFRSAARWRGRRAVGVVLSGTLDDGTAGQLAIDRCGGVTVVQDPRDALYPGMPKNVLAHVCVDHVVPAAGIGPLLSSLCREQIDDDDPAEPDQQIIQEVAFMDETVSSSPDPPGSPAGLGCATCGGSLFEIRDGDMVRFRCRVGHAWSPESLLAEQSVALESALWLALRTLEDRAALCRRSEEMATRRGHTHTAARYGVLADEATAAARLMRAALERARPPAVEHPAGPGSPRPED